MIEADKILNGVELDTELRGESHLYSPGLGYACLQMAKKGDHNYITAIGFTGQRQKSISVKEGAIRSVTELNLLQDEERSIKMQARGVGTRMYNTPQACLGTGEGDAISAYVFDVEVDKIVDRRSFLDGTNRGRIAQAARQAGRILQTKVMGLEATVDKIHASFGDPSEVDAVLYGQSATMEREQHKLGGVEQPEGIAPAFMVIRNPHIIMHKVGEYRPC